LSITRNSTPWNKHQMKKSSHGLTMAALFCTAGLTWTKLEKKLKVLTKFRHIILNTI